MEEYVCITTERYEQLIRAEQDANLLKALIANAYENYDTIGRDGLSALYAMFIGKKEEE